MFVWHDVAPRSAAAQMAIDRTLADHASRNGVAVMRLYRWAGDSVSFGANEAAVRTWDRERLERLKVPCVRRPTGGRGVWHDTADLTYAVTAPLDRYGDLRTAYRLIHEQLARAFCGLGIDASVAPSLRRPTLAPGACFDLAIGGEVMVEGRKTVGSAQALIGRTLLQHGAIALADRGSMLARFRLDATDVNPDFSAGAFPVPGLVADAILTTWLAEGATTAPTELVEAMVRESAGHAAHFQDHDWTWRR